MLAATEKTLGKAHPGALKSMNSLMSTYGYHGRWKGTKKPEVHALVMKGSSEKELAFQELRNQDLSKCSILTEGSYIDIWAAIFADGKTDISFESCLRNPWSLTNEAKRLIEYFVREPINWWPLSPRRNPLLDGFG